MEGNIAVTYLVWINYKEVQNYPDFYNSGGLTSTIFLHFPFPLLTVAVIQAEAAITQAQLSGPVRSRQAD